MIPRSELRGYTLNRIGGVSRECAERRKTFGAWQRKVKYAILLCMTKSTYVKQLKDVVFKFDPQGSNRYFLFGSSVRKKKFHDIDLGIVGNKKSRKNISELRDRFYDSRIPYKIDVVDFDAADSEFREHVLHNEPVVWIL